MWLLACDCKYDFMCIWVSLRTALAMLQVTMYITYDSAEPLARKPEAAQSQFSSPRDDDVSQGVTDPSGQRQTRRLRVKIGIHSGNVIRCVGSHILTSSRC